MAQGHNKLIDKIDAFTRKYYQNQIIKGAIYFVAIGLAAYLFSVTVEYFGRFPSGLRAFLFYGLIITYLALLYRFIVVPSMKLFSMGKIISHEDAATIIGAHFPEVKDKLLNTLQLSHKASLNNKDSELLFASIDQRMGDLQPVPFASAVDFGENKKYLKYIVPPVLLALLLLVVAPSVLKDGTKRIISYDVEYVAEAPFSFVLQNDELAVPLNEDFTLAVETSGSYAPSEITVMIGTKSFRMKPTGATGAFEYRFKNVREPIAFKLNADGFDSDGYVLEVLPTPSISHFTIDLAYPKYLKKEDVQLANTGNIKVPEGSFVGWDFSTQHAEHLFIAFSDTSVKLETDKDQTFLYSRKIMASDSYSVAAINSIVGGKDTIRYQIEVIKDQFPKIEVEENIDSLNVNAIYFGGTISDDYGLNNLFFKYNITRATGKEESETEQIRITSNTAQEFFFFKNFESFDLQAGDKVTYFFEVWDNDGIHGSKSSKSISRNFDAPTLSELEEERKQSSEDIKEKLEKSITDAAELQKELSELNKDLLEKSEMGWQEKKRIEDVLKKQKELEKNVEELKSERSKSQKKQEQFNQESERIMQKQEMLEKMFDELMSEEMKEMYKKLEEMMKELNQEEIREELENMEMSSEELEKELDRTLEIFKQMELEQEFEKTMEDLEKLAEEQEKLAEETKEGEKTEEELKKEQEELNEKFEDIKEKMDELEKLNEELERPNEMPDTDEAEEKIQEEMDKASEELEKGKEKKASESQENAADEMQEMAEAMAGAMQSQQSQKAEEDMEALRALLENIIQLSFDQEEIMDGIKSIEKDDPRYVEMGQKQKKLEDDSQMVEDSLFALSKRIPQLESIVNKEIVQVNQNHAKAIADIGERMTANALSRQQYVMTSYNNLALLLDEALQQMQMQMASQMPGKGNCEKPGGKGSKPSEGKMSKAQEQMGKKLEQMMKEMEKGKNEGGKKPGMGKGQGGMSKEIAKMAAEQAAIRREVEKMAQQLNEGGKGEGKGLEKLAQEMEKTEKDLVNQEIDIETLKRQQDIMTRLLKSEKAEREREYDNKRESNTPKSYEPSNPEKYLEYNKRKAREIELLRTVPPDLNPYYKDRVNEYFLNFEN